MNIKTLAVGSMVGLSGCYGYYTTGTYVAPAATYVTPGTTYVAPAVVTPTVIVPGYRTWWGSPFYWGHHHHGFHHHR